MFNLRNHRCVPCRSQGDDGDRERGDALRADLEERERRLTERKVRLASLEEKREADRRALARLEGIFAGFSSGANLQAAAGLLREKEYGKNVVFLVCDSGLKYLSTDLYR